MPTRNFESSSCGRRTDFGGPSRLMFPTEKSVEDVFSTSVSSLKPLSTAPSVRKESTEGTADPITVILFLPVRNWKAKEGLQGCVDSFKKISRPSRTLFKNRMELSRTSELSLYRLSCRYIIRENRFQKREGKNCVFCNPFNTKVLQGEFGYC